MSEKEKIVVFAVYDTVIDANIAKTKLDAYGIPCFLTDENLTGLYPMRNVGFAGTRLHVFEKDTPQVKEILEDKGESSLVCPYCGSTKINSEDSSTFSQKFYGVISALLFGLISPPKKTFHCYDCERDFDNPENF